MTNTSPGQPARLADTGVSAAVYDPRATAHRYRPAGRRYRPAIAAVAGAAVLVTSWAATARAGGNSAAAPELTWSACQDKGYECAEAKVPLDYRKPDGRSLSLAVIRRKAKDPAKKLGTLVLQPGGPGGSGVDHMLSHYDKLPAELRERFDVLGFDARGVKRSEPLECLNDEQYAKEVAAAKGRPGEDALDSAAASAVRFNDACMRASADLLPYVGTDFVARDIDQLRQAVGEDQLTFYGRSFGTYIGTVYASRFPERVRAMALDGAYDPVLYADQPYTYDREQYLALDAAMGRFLDWCAQAPTACTFGDSDPRAAFDKLLRDLDTEPVTTAAGGKANGYTVAYRLMFHLNDGKAKWSALGEALHKAEQRDNTSLLLRPPSPESFHFLIPNVVVECVDRAYPTSLRRLKRELSDNVAAAPLLGPAIGLGPPTYDHNHATACVQWPGERASRYDGPYRAEGSAPILVIGTTGDPDTPYQDSVRLTRRLDNATLLTFKAEGHAAFGRSPCTTAAVTAYLTDLTVPPAGTVCEDEAPPKQTPPEDGPGHPAFGKLKL
ncbi:alpha/beta fold hydrolase [Streptomyces nigrescens]